jgi:hypothetical protein
MIALDSNVMTYWIDAMGSLDGPPAGPSSEEKIALARIYFWMPDESGFHLTPTVQREYEAIRQRVSRDNHESWRMVHISPVNPPPSVAAVSARADQLLPYHNGADDRRILAECELSEIDCLLTADGKFLRNLGPHADQVRICLPSEYWAAMRIERGVRPNRVPHHSNPLSQVDWWRW